MSVLHTHNVKLNGSGQADGTITVSGYCVGCDKPYEIKNVNAEEYRLHMNGQSTRRFFPDMNDEDRELLASGRCATCIEEFLDIPEEPEENFTDVEADAMTLASAGYGTDEDYGCYGGEDIYGDGDF